MGTKWDYETTLKFIQEYKSYPCLWNFKSLEYKNKCMRDAANHKIVKAMNIQGFGVPEVKNKIKNLRSTYSQEMKKIEDSKKSGSGVNNIYESNLKWLKELETVYKVNDKWKSHNQVEDDAHMQRESVSPVSRETADETLITESQCPQESPPRPRKRAKTMFYTPIQTESSSPANRDISDETLSVESQESPSRQRKRVRSIEPQMHNESVSPVSKETLSAASNYPEESRPKHRVKTIVRAIAYLKSLHESINFDPDEDAFEIFGRSVAMQLKKLSRERALVAQSRIQNLLTEFGIEDLREKNCSTYNNPISLEYVSSDTD